MTIGEVLKSEPTKRDTGAYLTYRDPETRITTIRFFKIDDPEASRLVDALIDLGIEYRIMGVVEGTE